MIQYHYIRIIFIFEFYGCCFFCSWNKGMIILLILYMIYCLIEVSSYKILILNLLVRIFGKFIVMKMIRLCRLIERCIMGWEELRRKATLLFIRLNLRYFYLLILL